MKVRSRQAFVSARCLVSQASSFDRVCADGLSIPKKSKPRWTASCTVSDVMSLRLFFTWFRQMRYDTQFARAQSRDVVSQYSFGRQPETLGGSKSCWPM